MWTSEDKKNITAVKTHSGINMWKSRKKTLRSHDIWAHLMITKKTFGFVMATHHFWSKTTGSETVGTCDCPAESGFFAPDPWYFNGKICYDAHGPQNPLDVKINLKAIVTAVKTKKQMHFKSNPGSYVNVYVQMCSMALKQKHFRKPCHRWK